MLYNRRYHSQQPGVHVCYVSIENDWNFEILQYSKGRVHTVHTSCDPLGIAQTIPLASSSICIRAKLRVFHLGPNLRAQLSAFLSQNP